MNAMERHYRLWLVWLAIMVTCQVVHHSDFDSLAVAG